MGINSRDASMQGMAFSSNIDSVARDNMHSSVMNVLYKELTGDESKEETMAEAERTAFLARKLGEFLPLER